MIKLYSLNSQYPHELPFRITLSNGNTRTDPTTFTSAELLDAGYTLVDSPPPLNPSNEKLTWNSNSLRWEILPKTEEELLLDTQRASQSVREYRNKLLSESDWTQVLDAPVNRLAWAEYRQALRDVTSQETFPNSVAWPTPPTKE